MKTKKKPGLVGQRKPGSKTKSQSNCTTFSELDTGRDFTDYLTSHTIDELHNKIDRLLYWILGGLGATIATLVGLIK